MQRLRRLGRAGRLVLALAVGGAIFGIATAVQADIPDNGVIHGCYGKYNLQNLRVIDTSKGQDCLSNEIPLNWNATGVTGSRGATGPTGPTDAYSSFVGSYTTVNEGNSITVVHLTLPTGGYTLSGSVGAEVNPATPGPSDQASGSCDYSLGSGTVSTLSQVQTNWFLSEFEIGDTFVQTLPLNGVVDVTSATATINLTCSNQSGAQVSLNGSLIATRVRTLH